MRLIRAAIFAAGAIVVACTEHAVTAPRVDEEVAAKAVSPGPTQSNGRFEPVGYARAVERAFVTKAQNPTDVTGAEGWDATEYRYGALSLTSDNAAPRSAPSVMQVTYQRRSQGGQTLARVATSLQGDLRQVYVSLWMKLSPTWQGRGDLAQLWIAGAPRLSLGIDATTAAAPTITASLSNSRRRVVISSTTQAASLTRGTWHRIEIVTKSNKPGTADGLLDLWIDGTQTIAASNLQYVNSGESDLWQQVALAPTWGTSSDRVAQTMYMWWDHIYVSGSSSTADPVFGTLTVAAAAVDPTIFSDDFEAGDLSAWQDGVNATKHHVLNDSTLAHSGTHVLAMTYPAGQGGGWLTRFFMPGYDSIYVSYWVRPDSTWTGSTALLGLRGSRTDNQWSSFGKAIVCPNGSDFFSTSVVSGSASTPLDLLFSTYYPGMTAQSDGTCRGASQGIGSTTYGTSRHLSPGVWHKVEFFVRLNTVGQSDGVQRMWLDGQLAGEWTGLVLRTNNVLQLNSLMLDGSATASHTQTLYIDDVQVLGAMPSVQPPPPPPPVASVAVTLNSPTLLVGQSTQATATLKDASGNTLSDRPITWSSSDSTIATVSSSGLVTAVKIGSATITATSEGVSGTSTITVAPPPVATVSVTLNSPSLTVGQSTQAVATLKDANGNVLTGRTTSWTSSNTGVATVNATGYVTSVAAGSTSITATSEGVSGSVSLTVVAPPPPPSDNAIFSEDFESGTLANWQDGVDPTRQRVLNDASLAHSGSHVLEMTYPANSNAGWLSRFFMPGYDQLYVSYWIRLEPTWQGTTKLLDLRGSRIDNQWSAFGKAGICPTGSDYFSTNVTLGTFGGATDMSFYVYYPGMSREPDGVTCYGRYQGTGTTTYASDRRVTTGVWHKIEFYVKLNTVGQNDAVQRMWLDGQLKGEWTGFPLRTDNVLRLNSVTLDGSTDGWPQTRHLYIDDVVVLGAMPNAPPPAPVASVSVGVNNNTLNIGDTTSAIATLRDASGNILTQRSITWSSSNTAVATVSASGVVRAVGAGSSAISATSEGVTGSASVTVNAPVTPAPVASVTVTLNSPSLVVGENTQATATLRDASGNVLTGRTIAWTSSNSSVASVTTSGSVSALAAGTSTISATSEGISGAAPITVTAPAVATVSVALNSPSLTVGQSTQAVATLRDANGNVLTGRAVTWSSSNTLVATVNSSGLVSAVAGGTASIRATSEGVTGAASLNVTLVPVASISVTLATSTVTVGQQTQATAVLRDVSGNILTGRTIVWSSSSPAVATVDGSGKVVGVAAGSATITATSEGQSGSASLTVNALTPPPPGDGTEPQFVLGTSRVAFSEDFERYTNASSFTTGGWALSTTSMPLSAPLGSGQDGLGRGAQLAWTTGLDWIGADHGVGDQGGSRVAYMSWDYRAPNFSYGGTQTAQLEKKHMIINLGQNTRITVEMHGYAGEEALVVAMVQTSGPYLFENPSVTPWGDQHATIQHLTDGAWHHFTVKRTAESRNGALDGAIELWLDGQKLFNMQNIGTSTDRIINCEFGSTFNGGSPKNQTEWYDNIRIWY